MLERVSLLQLYEEAIGKIPESVIVRYLLVTCLDAGMYQVCSVVACGENCVSLCHAWVHVFLRNV